MSDYYVNLDLAGTGGTGDIGTPWTALDFYNQPFFGKNFFSSDTIYIKGIHVYTTINSTLYFGGPNTNQANIKNWELTPWRVSFSASGSKISIFDSPKVYNGIFGANNTLSQDFQNDSAEYYDCMFYCQAQPLKGIFKGCTFISTFAITAAANCAFTDCIFISGSPVSFDSSVITDHCVFTDAVLPDGTHTFSQVGWSAPAMPAWNDPQASFSSTILSAGISTPPEYSLPLPAFTGYETGLWGTPRTGIGAMDFQLEPEPVSTCWNFTAMFKGTKRFFKMNGPGNCPSELQVPSNVDLSSGVMMEHGKRVEFNRFKIL